jgi:integrase
MPKITKRFVDSLKPSEGREAFHWDSALPGFGIRVKPSGTASYLIQYRTKGGATRRLTVGKAGTFTPEEARSRARRELARVADGRDPSAERKATRAVKTFAELVEDWQVTNAAWLARGEASKHIDQGRINSHLLPLLGARTIDAINRETMERAFRDIRDGRTAIDKPSGKKRGRTRVMGGPGTARRTLALASAIFAHAMRKGLIPSNPCHGVETGRDGQRDTILESAEDYARMFAALARLEAERAVAMPAADALRLIALTGARRGEITGLKWRNVDLTNGRIILQLHEHKTGHAASKPKIIPLPAMALEILAAMTPGESDELVVRSARKGARIDLKKAWERVKGAAGLPTGLTIHGFRHSIASHLAMGGASGPEIQAAMGHASIKTSVRYIHFAEARRNELAERAASVATAGLAASRGRAAGEVVITRDAA